MARSTKFVAVVDLLSFSVDPLCNIIAGTDIPTFTLTVKIVNRFYCEQLVHL